MVELTHTRKIVLVVDDDNARRRVMRQMIEEYTGHTTLATNCGKDSIEQILNTAVPAPNLVMIELALPGMGGLEVARIIHTLMPHLPIIFHTEQGFEEEVHRLMRAGGIDILTRPISLERMNVAIERAFTLMKK